MTNTATAESNPIPLRRRAPAAAATAGGAGQLALGTSACSNCNLRLTRDDIGSYLGLTVGTISRVFTKFDEAGLIAVRGKSVSIVDKAGLERVGGQALP